MRHVIKVYNIYKKLFPDSKDRFEPSAENVKRWTDEIREKMREQYENSKGNGEYGNI